MRHLKIDDWVTSNSLESINPWTRDTIEVVIRELRAFDRDQHTARHYVLADHHLASHAKILSQEYCAKELELIASLQLICKDFFSSQIKVDEHRCRVQKKILEMENDIKAYQGQINSLEDAQKYSRAAIESYKRNIEDREYKINEAIDFLNKADLPDY